MFAMNPTAVFARCWAKARIAEREGRHLEAAVLYEIAASDAPTPVEAHLALTCAWIAYEHAQGRRSDLEVGDVGEGEPGSAAVVQPMIRRRHGHEGAVEDDAPIRVEPCARLVSFGQFCDRVKGHAGPCEADSDEAWQRQYGHGV
jgi:hypothetical protein